MHVCINCTDTVYVVVYTNLYHVSTSAQVLLLAVHSKGLQAIWKVL